MSTTPATAPAAAVTDTAGDRAGAADTGIRARWIRRPIGAVLDIHAEGGRPALLDVLFWVALLATYTADMAFLVRAASVGWAGFVAVTLVAILLAALWRALPWDTRASRRRKLAVPAFLLLSSVLSFAGGFGPLLYLLVFANGVFVFGLRGGLAYAVVPPVIVFATVVAFPYRTVWEAAREALWAASIGAFAVGVSVAVVQARRSREETAGLLRELESAHDELRGYAERVRELTVTEERARMAREMHDSVGHYLTVINVGLENAKRFRERRPEDAWDEVGQAQQLTQEALGETRRWVRALKPLAMEEKTGTAALAALVSSFDGSGVAATFHVHGDPPQLTEEAELASFRAVQEGLTNALRHGRPSRIDVSLNATGRTVHLRVADDGGGGPPERGTAAQGFGLSSVEERVTNLGGDVATSGEPGQGFALDVYLPAAQW